MAENSKIEWTDATWQPITGCSIVSPGCTNCYAMRLAGTRLRHHPSRVGLTRETKAGPVWTGDVRLNEAWLAQPLRWAKPRRIFVCAHGDLFHESVPDEWIDRVFAVMALCPQHTFQVLTKRAERMRVYVNDPSAPRRVSSIAGARVTTTCWPLPNVWLGVSVEDQRRADERIPHLLATPAAVRFLSCEPLLGPVDLHDWLTRDWHPTMPPETTSRIDWVIAGGESGPGARPTHPDWVRSLRDQTIAADARFFFKQWGEWKDWRQFGATQWVNETPLRKSYKGPCIGTFLRLGGDLFGRPMQSLHTHGKDATIYTRVGKHAAGALLDGREWREFPCG